MILVFRAESECETDVDGERITGRGVDSFADVARRANSRFKIILRFKVFFVQQIINRKIYVNPFFQTLGNGKINNVVSGGADVFDFSVKPVI